MNSLPPQPRFGPAGNSERFYSEGFKRTVDAFRWQQPLGLTAFEYPFGRGIKLSPEAAREIGAAAVEAGVSISAHAPYYINFGSADEEAQQKSQGYVAHAAKLLHLMGGDRLVVHVGSPGKRHREDALHSVRAGLLQARQQLVEAGLPHIRLCIETMGRPSVIGTLEEVLGLVQLDDSFLPCIDFAHLHAAGGGAIRTQEDFAAVLDQAEQALGIDRARQMHAHFSHIEYGPKGELRHRIFADEGFGPDFGLLAPLLAQRDYRLTVICESRGTMADDAAVMLRQFRQARALLMG